jgi:hypothetical protein
MAAINTEKISSIQKKAGKPVAMMSHSLEQAMLAIGFTSQLRVIEPPAMAQPLK